MIISATFKSDPDCSNFLKSFEVSFENCQKVEDFRFTYIYQPASSAHPIIDVGLSILA